MSLPVLTARLHAGLTEAGLPAICIETHQAKAAIGAMPNKTDRDDARGIAQIMRTGLYRAVHLKSPTAMGVVMTLVPPQHDGRRLLKRYCIRGSAGTHQINYRAPELRRVGWAGFGQSEHPRGSFRVSIEPGQSQLQPTVGLPLLDA